MFNARFELCRAAVGRAVVPTAAALAFIAPFGSAQAEAIGPDFADMVEQVLPAVVTVSVETHRAGVMDQQQGVPNPFNRGNPFSPFGPFGPGQGFPGQQGPDQGGGAILGSGSGFIIDETGFVVTNNHVIDNADQISITLADGDSYDATLVGTDPSTDIALLKIDSDGETFPTVAWGDSDSLRIGNWVVAVGGPFGLSGTVTAGIVSATGRDLNAGPYDDFIQFDAQINPGNSGGPVFNTDGEVVAVSTAIVTPSRGSVGIGFAVPAAMAQPVIESLMIDGTVARGYLGVHIQEVSEELAQAMDLDRPMGALVAEVQSNTPAAAAGVEAGDLIVGFDGHQIDRVRDLPRLVAGTQPGTEVTLDVVRDGEPLTLTFKVGELPQDRTLASAATPDVGQTIDKLGFAVAAAADYGWRGANGETDGVVVTQVAPDTAADEAGLLVGDVILAIGGEHIASPAAMAELIAARADDGQEVIALLIERDGDRRFVPLPLATS